MHALLSMIWMEFKLVLREPIGMFFVLAFPLLVLFTFGSIFGNAPSAEFGGRGSVDVSTPGLIGMIIGSTGLLTLPITLATYRERGILRRYSASPLSPLVVLGAQACVHLVLITLGVFFLVIAARIFYGLHLPEEPLAVLGAYLISCLSFLTLGFVLAGLAPTARTAVAVGNVLFFPMLFLSGGAVPRELMPKLVQEASEFLPLTHITILLGSTWSGAGWQMLPLAVLGGILIAGIILSAKTFRWE